MLAHIMGAKVEPSPFKEIGWFPVKRTEQAKRNEVATCLQMKSWHFTGTARRLIFPGGGNTFCHK